MWCEGVAEPWLVGRWHHVAHGGIEPDQPHGIALTQQQQRHGGRQTLGVGQFGFVPQWVKSASDAKLRSTKSNDDFLSDIAKAPSGGG